MHLEERPDLGIDTFALTGTPADCMMVALDHASGLLRSIGGLQPVLALSGPNYGSNVSTDILLSGTINASRTASIFGVPSLATSSLSLDKDDTLEETVDAAVVLVDHILHRTSAEPARNWPRNSSGAPPPRGRRHRSLSSYYHPDAVAAAAAPTSQAEADTLLWNSFLDADVFLNLNVPIGWRIDGGKYLSSASRAAANVINTAVHSPAAAATAGQESRFTGGSIRTTGLGVMFYQNSFEVTHLSTAGLSGDVAKEAVLLMNEENRVPVAAAVGGGGGSNLPTYISASNKVVSGSSLATPAPRRFAMVFNNAYDTRVQQPIEMSDVNALQEGVATLTTLQSWPEGHPYCLSDAVMARSLTAGNLGLPSWLYGL